MEKCHQEACSTQGCHKPSLCKLCNDLRSAIQRGVPVRTRKSSTPFHKNITTSWLNITLHTRESIIPIQRTGIFFPIHLCKDAQGFQPDCHRHGPRGHPNFIHVCPKLTWRRAGLPLSTLELQTPRKPVSNSHGLGLFLPL